MVDKALMAIQATGLYSTAILEWNGFDEMNQTWPELKSHFAEAYDIRLHSGAGATNIYHGAANTYEIADNDSLGSITQSLTSMHLANNANAQSMLDTMSELLAALAATQQHVALLLRAQPATQWTPPPPAYTAPPPAYATPPPPAYYPPPTYQQPSYQQYGRGGEGRGGGAGRGKRNKNHRTGAGFGARPPTAPAAGGWTAPPTTATASGTNVPNPVKHFNNWNMCFSCGFDIPAWHTSKTCPQECRQAGHQTNCDQNNYASFKAQGHAVKMTGSGKTQLPTNPHPGWA